MKTEDNRFLEVLKRYISMKLILAMVFLLGVGSILVYFSFIYPGSLIFQIFGEAGKALFITAVISGGVKWYMTRQYLELEKEKEKILYRDLFETLTNLQNKIVEQLTNLGDKVSQQTDRMIDSASSLDALQRTDVIRFYSNRNEATSDVKTDIQDPNITYLRIIGISLNDFLRPGNPIFHDEIWKTIEHYIIGKTSPRKPLDIKILLIDPNCYGAYHRSKAEETIHIGVAGRLETDVLDSIKTLHKIEHQARQDGKVNFEVKLYRTPPILYLVQTDFVSYVQQYYFWPEYNPNLNIPTIRYQGRISSEAQGCSIHDEMKFHFKYLWDNCSITTHEYLEEYNRGYDEVIRIANIKNVYYMYSEKDLCKEKMLYLMNTTKDILYIKGISLRSFFRTGKLFDTFCKIATKEGLEVKILLIDPECEQAKFRSFREYLLKNPDTEFRNFQEEETLRKSQDLYKDVEVSIGNIKDYLKELSREGKKHNIAVRVYSSAPECFMLLTDDSVLVEQYHYGKISPPEKETEKIKSRLLGGDVPAIEYKKPDSEMLKTHSLRNPYEIFKNHFEYVFKYCSKSVEEI